MTMMLEPEIDFRIEIRIAGYWRSLIGDLQYVKFDPKDMLRWYLALDLLGPVDVRSLLTEREGSRPMPVLHGIVARAPHPPVWIIRQWLDTHETKLSTKPYWIGAGMFISLAFLIGLGMSGCQNLRPMNPLVMNPPQTSKQVAGAPKASIRGPTDLPPVNPKAPTITATGPKASGISGGGASASPSTSAGSTPSGSTPH